MAEHIAERLTAPGPKRMLALDGGGVRGMISVGFLERIEEILRQRHGRNDYVLADYFDMIGGTSVGSILATMLALGWPVARVRREFGDAADDIFGWTSHAGLGLLWPRFSDRQLCRHMTRILGDARLDSELFKTGLAIVAKRVDSGSPWVVYNNPHTKYWDDRTSPTGRVTVGNRHFRVADLIRASTAAPTYFKPHRIQLFDRGDEKDRWGHFVDGGISPYNDPSLLMFMMAGIRGYRLGGVEADAQSDADKLGISWRLGRTKLLIISVGTGDFRYEIRSRGFRPAALFGGNVLRGMIADAQSTTLKTMQWLADPKDRENPMKPWSINGEVGDLRFDTLGELIGAPDGFLSYARYNIRLENEWLRTKLSLKPLSKRRIRNLQRVDDPCELPTYQLLGRLAAAKQVTPDDFPWQFDNHKCG